MPPCCDRTAQVTAMFISSTSPIIRSSLPDRQNPSALPKRSRFPGNLDRLGSAEGFCLSGKDERIIGLVEDINIAVTCAVRSQHGGMQGRKLCRLLVDQDRERDIRSSTVQSVVKGRRRRRGTSRGSVKHAVEKPRRVARTGNEIPETLKHLVH